MKIEILPCTLKHLRELANNLRAGDCAELMWPGRKARHILHDLWLRTENPRCAIVDDAVAACWGSNSSLLTTEAEMWLFTTPVVEKVPLRFFKQARHEMKQMLTYKHVLVSCVASDYTKALRFFEMLGFSVGAEQRLGPDQRAFREIRMER